MPDLNYQSQQQFIIFVMDAQTSAIQKNVNPSMPAISANKTIAIQ